MKTFLNVIWHFPFLGFLFALAYAVAGLLACLTILLIPVGLGLFQLARFMLAPFSYAMVSKKELALVTGDVQPAAWTTYALIVRILYFPFGLMAAAGAIVLMAGEFLSIIGIPCGIVWAKALTAIFNPVNKVCVPKSVADEIERRKQLKQQNEWTENGARPQTAAPRPSDPGETDRMLAKALEKSDDELKAILREKEEYNPALVKAVERVLLARISGEEIAVPQTVPEEDAREELPTPKPLVATKPDLFTGTLQALVQNPKQFFEATNAERKERIFALWIAALFGSVPGMLITTGANFLFDWQYPGIHFLLAALGILLSALLPGAAYGALSRFLPENATTVRTGFRVCMGGIVLLGLAKLSNQLHWFLYQENAPIFFSAGRLIANLAIGTGLCLLPLGATYLRNAATRLYGYALGWLVVENLFGIFLWPEIYRVPLLRIPIVAIYDVVPWLLAGWLLWKLNRIRTAPENEDTSPAPPKKSRSVGVIVGGTAAAALIWIIAYGVHYDSTEQLFARAESRQEQGDAREALALYRKIVERDNDAEATGSACYRIHELVCDSPDIRETEYLIRAAEVGYPDAQSKLGLIYFRNGKTTEAAPYLLKAEAHDPCARRCLGVLYYGGNGVPQDFGKAAECLKDGGDPAFPVTYFYRGNLFLTGAYGTGDPLQNAMDAASCYRWAQTAGYNRYDIDRRIRILEKIQERQVENEPDTNTWEWGAGDKWTNTSYAGGDRYIGEIKSSYDQTRHGYGIYTWKKGTSYYGPFVNGFSEGIGIETYDNGNMYIGEFIRDKRTGGVYCWSDGSSSDDFRDH